jgi:hypothetical protein
MEVQSSFKRQGRMRYESCIATLTFAAVCQRRPSARI